MESFGEFHSVTPSLAPGFEQACRSAYVVLTGALCISGVLPIVNISSYVSL